MRTRRTTVLLAALVSFLLLGWTANRTATPPTLAQTVGYTVQGGVVRDPQGNPIQLRGVNWFGFETDIHVVHGLWARN